MIRKMMAGFGRKTPCLFPLYTVLSNLLEIRIYLLDCSGTHFAMKPKLVTSLFALALALVASGSLARA